MVKNRSMKNTKKATKYCSHSWVFKKRGSRLEPALCPGEVSQCSPSGGRQSSSTEREQGCLWRSVELGLISIMYSDTTAEGRSPLAEEVGTFWLIYRRVTPPPEWADCPKASSHFNSRHSKPFGRHENRAEPARMNVGLPPFIWRERLAIIHTPVSLTLGNIYRQLGLQQPCHVN